MSCVQLKLSSPSPRSGQSLWTNGGRCHKKEKEDSGPMRAAEEKRHRVVANCSRPQALHLPLVLVAVAVLLLSITKAVCGLCHLTTSFELWLSTSLICTRKALENRHSELLCAYRLSHDSGSSTDVQVFFVCGYLFSAWKTEIYLRRSVHGWRLRRGILFPYMGDSIVYGLKPHPPLRCYMIHRCDMYSA
jgi:hypothetical protein